jgi:TetR/AcrR family transcriptional regulator
MRRKTKPAVRATRDPERTRGRILSAALAEFAARGFAGARVDAIARRAQSNKRMIYHYFGSKQGLFREVLRRKITERRAVIEGSSGDPVENLPLRFTMMCRDLDWIRLLGWEAVQNTGDRVQEEKFRREGTARARARVRREQAAGHVASGFDARHLVLAKLSLAMFPAAFPHSTRLITGKSIRDPAFQREYANFLKRFAVAFRPSPQRARPPAK